MLVRGKTSCGIFATILGAVLIAPTAQAGTECRGIGTWKSVFPKPTCAAHTQALVVINRSDGAWTAWAHPRLAYDSTGTVLSATNVPFEFSDRYEPTCGGSFTTQNFSVSHVDFADISITQDGHITVGTGMAQATCSGTNGQMFGPFNDGAILVSFSAPECDPIIK